MKITALRLQGAGGWPDLEISAVSPGLSGYYGPTGSGKTTAADFLAHVLYGKLPMHGSRAIAERVVPDGEATVQSRSGRFRLRRYDDGTSAARLTVASLDDRPVDTRTVRGMLGGLSPVVLSRLFAVSFDESPPVTALLSGELASEFRALMGEGAVECNRRLKELVARRDALARELETRIASDRRASGELDEQSRRLDDALRDANQAARALDERLRSVEGALAETDARLRYRRLELNVELRWNTLETVDQEPQRAELDQEIARWRTILADVSTREESVRARLTRVQPTDGAAVGLANQQGWMAVARQLAADLEGEVARLARAAASQQCACRDAHPRLRPIVETLQRQLDVLDSLVIGQQQAAQAAALRDEADHLARSRAELRRQLDYLLDRRQSIAHTSKPNYPVPHDSSAGLTAADAEQLEQRRLELEQERFELVQEVQSQQRRQRELRSQRARIDRERASLLSARSIEHVQRELADVQRKLANFAGSSEDEATGAAAAAAPPRASDYLAQLTAGRLVRLELIEGGRNGVVINQAGETLLLESLAAPERDQVYLSLSLALVAAAAQHGVQLPLVLDEPFARLDSSGVAALAAVLDHFSRQGHQILVFTARRAAADRLASLGVPVNDLLSLRRCEQSPVASSSKSDTRAAPTAKKPRKTPAGGTRKRSVRRRRGDNPSSSGQSDAA